MIAVWILAAIDVEAGLQLKMKTAQACAWLLCRSLITFAALAHPLSCHALRGKTVMSAIGKKEDLGVVGNSFVAFTIKLLTLVCSSSELSNISEECDRTECPPVCCRGK